MANSASTTRKGIVLAGGYGTRLYPSTVATTKQLLPIYDKPLIYYPLSVLLYAGVREILVICMPETLASFRLLLGNGSRFGVSIQYETQDQPRGLAEAFLIGKEFIGNDQVVLILGDNIFFGQGLGIKLDVALSSSTGATVFTYPVCDPSAFGVISFDEHGNPDAIEEKPESPKSKYALTGLYFFDNDVIQFASEVEPSKRGELEITDLIRKYMERGDLVVETFGRGFSWFDTGTHESMLQASTFVEAIQKRQGLMIACLEEIALRKGFISADKLASQIPSHKNDYTDYLRELVLGQSP
jgi:glucose-1-phosphate thymidylyltransferase